MFAVTTVQLVCLGEQLACYTAECGGMHVDVNGKFLVVLLDFKQNWNE